MEWLNKLNTKYKDMVQLSISELNLICVKKCKSLKLVNVYSDNRYTTYQGFMNHNEV